MAGRGRVECVKTIMGVRGVSYCLLSLAWGRTNLSIARCGLVWQHGVWRSLLCCVMRRWVGGYGVVSHIYITELSCIVFFSWISGGRGSGCEQKLTELLRCSGMRRWDDVA